jgi:ferrous iron transport protein B
MARGAREPRIALVGNPNTGKTTLFNRLCGLSAKTANFPGTTTDARFGRSVLGTHGTDATGGGALTAEMVDLPGLYRLALDLPESRIARQALGGEGLYQAPDAVVVVVDATNLVRNLVLVSEIQEYRLPTVVVLNMVDLAQRRGLTIDEAQLARHLGCPVVPAVARKGTGVDELRDVLAALVGESATAWIERRASATAPSKFDCLEDWAEAVVEDSAGGTDAVGGAADTVTERLDQAFTHPVLGVLVFAAIMGGLFWTLFSLATVPMDLIDATFAHLGTWVGDTVPVGPVRDLLVDGIIAGIAGTVVFLPQICLLFFLISLLEDTGYLARAAFVMDRIFCRFGLPGQAFVPFLSSHACAIPGIMASKLIPDRQDRLTTILVAPLMSCSARLPVYVLLTSLLFADRPVLAATAFAACYLLGASAALGTAFVFRRTLLKGRSRPMVLELPSYKMPSLRNAFISAKDQGVAFLRTAGTVIMAICVVMWWLSAYPKAGPSEEAQALRAQAETAATVSMQEELETAADRLDAQHAQERSFAGRIGHAIEPVFAPLGYDWQLTVGVLTSFLAREVFVSTMAVLLVGDDEASLTEDDSGGVMHEIRTARRDDGSVLLTPATSASLLIFYVLAMQCLATLAVVRKETGSWRWAGLQFAYMTVLAYVAAFVTFQGLRLMGIS